MGIYVKNNANVVKGKYNRLLDTASSIAKDPKAYLVDSYKRNFTTQKAPSPREFATYATTQRGFIIPVGFTDLSEGLIFQFNPSEMRDNKVSDWQANPMLGFSYLNYLWMSGGARQISFTLHFEATGNMNTKFFGRDTEFGEDTIDTLLQVFPYGTMEMVDKLRSYLYPILKSNKAVKFVGGNATTQDRFSHPPVLIFSFGDMYLEAVLSGADITHSLFDEDLVPRRTDVAVVLSILEGYNIVPDQRIFA